MNDFVKRARKAAPSRNPVRDVVGECLPDIRAGREDGLSWAAIYGQLTRDGKRVGKGPSSLRNAVLYWDKLGTATPAAPRSVIDAKIGTMEQLHAGSVGTEAPSTSRAHDNLLASSIPASIGDDEEDFKVRRAPRD